MVCEHLKEMYQLCQDQKLLLGSSDLIRVVCTQCDQQEVCPSNLVMMIDGNDEGSDGVPKAAK